MGRPGPGLLKAGGGAEGGCWGGRGSGAGTADTSTLDLLAADLAEGTAVGEARAASMLGNDGAIVVVLGTENRRQDITTVRTSQGEGRDGPRGGQRQGDDGRETHYDGEGRGGRGLE